MIRSAMPIVLLLLAAVPLTGCGERQTQQGRGQPQQAGGAMAGAAESQQAATAVVSPPATGQSAALQGGSAPEQRVPAVEPDPHQSLREQAHHDFQQGDYAAAVSRYQQLAEQGDAESAMRLGMMYLRGEGVAKNSSRAFSLMRRAAERDHPQAQYLLASMYAYGQGVSPNTAKAAIWSERAMANGYGRRAEASGDTRQPGEPAAGGGEAQGADGVVLPPGAGPSHAP